MDEHEMRNPDLQVEIVASGSTFCSICFWTRQDVHDGFDVAIAITDKDGLGVVRTALQSALQALDGADWHSVDELAALVGEESEESPF